MKEDLMEVVAILDMSGSMHPLTADTVGGFNAYISQLQKAEKEVKLTLVLFNTCSKIVYQHKNVRECPELTSNEYMPNSGTALIDALGLAIDNMKQHIALLPDAERPGQVSFFVSTDGEENSSKKYN